MAEDAGKRGDRLSLDQDLRSPEAEHRKVPTRSGVVRLFQVSGITVFLHWSWVLVAMYEIATGAGRYTTPVWNVVEYLGLFVIITLHEFGHAFACRSVGGRANEIMLWPLGGVAFVDPPTRPGATLWSIAAGPLVNVALLPVVGSLAMLVPYSLSPDVHVLLRTLTRINIGLLIFNLLPVYPLDGGQILGSLLWFMIGRARSIVVTAVIGLAGVAGLALLAFLSFSPWLGLIAWFVGLSCLGSLRLAKSLKELARAPSRHQLACPSCRARPPVGLFWTCRACGATFDMFDPSAGAVAPPSATEVTTLSLSADPMVRPAVDVVPGQCPMCHTQFAAINCLECNSDASLAEWRSATGDRELGTGDSTGVTRLRQPRVPSVAPLVSGVCLGILSLTVIAVAVRFFTLGSGAPAGGPSSAHAIATASIAFGAILAGGTVWLLARYRHRRREFAAATRRFLSERAQGAGA